VLGLSSYWEATRDLYAPYESNMRYSSSDVYYHEMPGEPGHIRKGWGTPTLSVMPL
jgi:pyruvate carboxylase